MLQNHTLSPDILDGLVSCVGNIRFNSIVNLRRQHIFFSYYFDQTIFNQTGAITSYIVYWHLCQFLCI